MKKKRYHDLQFKEGWHRRTYCYLNCTLEEAWKMYREDTKDDPANPANWKRGKEMPATT